MLKEEWIVLRLLTLEVTCSFAGQSFQRGGFSFFFFFCSWAQSVHHWDPHQQNRSGEKLIWNCFCRYKMDKYGWFNMVNLIFPLVSCLRSPQANPAGTQLAGKPGLQSWAREGDWGSAQRQETWKKFSEHPCQMKTGKDVDKESFLERQDHDLVKAPLQVNAFPHSFHVL